MTAPCALAVWHIFTAARKGGHAEAVAFAMAMRHLLDLDPALSAADAYARVAEVIDGKGLITMSDPTYCAPPGSPLSRG